MAQDVTLLGASYPAVPAVLLPKTGGGTARFTDVSGTTATASDVASGKVFFAADGSLTEGTGSGGGGVVVTRTPDSHGGDVVEITAGVSPGSADLIVGALRPDAELIETFTYDKHLVQDEGINIPAYTTTATTLKASAALSPTVATDYTEYDYFVVERFLAIPEYGVTTKAKGRCEYWEGTSLYEITDVEAGTFYGLLEPTKSVATRSLSVQASSLYREIYYSSATALGVYATSSYGVYEGATAPTASASAITLRTPTLGIRGHATYLSSEYFGNIDDIRYQWRIEVRRAPKGSLNLDGYGLISSFMKAHAALSSQDHKLS